MDVAASPEGQAILQQLGVSYDVVLFYVRSNLVGKQVRGRLVAAYSPGLAGVVVRTTDEEA